MLAYKCGTCRTDVIPDVAKRAKRSIEKVETDRDPDVDSCVQGSIREMEHDERYEANERDDVLDYEDLVKAVADRGESAEI